MMDFKEYIGNNIYYHFTDKESAESIMKKGVDTSHYRGGMFVGLYLTKDKNLNNLLRKPYCVVFSLDESKIFDIDNISRKEIEDFEPSAKYASYGYLNHIKTKIIKSRGYSVIKNGNEYILLSNESIKSMKIEPIENL